MDTYNTGAIVKLEIECKYASNCVIFLVSDVVDVCIRVKISCVTVLFVYALSVLLDFPKMELWIVRRNFSHESDYGFA